MLTPRICLLTFLIGSLYSAEATTVIEAVEKCPACHKEFTVNQIGSWFQFDEPESDMGGTLMVASSGVQSCPFCLYAALPGDFENLNADEVSSIRAALKELSKTVRGFGNLKPRMFSRDQSMIDNLMEYRVAEVCDSKRRVNLARSAELAFAEYHASKNHFSVNDLKLLIPARTRAIDSIEKALKANAWDKDEKTFWTYMSGELRRRSGDLKGAIARLDEAAKSGDSRAKEQLTKAQAGDTNIPPAKMTIYGPETEKERDLLPSKLPRMLSAISGGGPPIEWLLPGKAAENTISLVQHEASKGNADAINFLIAWLGRLDAKELKAREGSLYRIVGTIASAREVASVPLLETTKFKVSDMGDVVRYAIKGGLFPTAAKKAIKKPPQYNAVANAAIAAAAVHKEKSIKPLLLDCLKFNIGFYMFDPALLYFSSAGDSGDLLALEKLIKPRRKKSRESFNSSNKDIEETIRNIRLREVFTDNELPPASSHRL